MFSSPSARVRRRQVATPAEGDVDSADNLKFLKHPLKRSISLASQGRATTQRSRQREAEQSAIALDADQQKQQQQAVVGDMASEYFTLARKRQATGPSSSGCLEETNQQRMSKIQPDEEHMYGRSGRRGLWEIGPGERTIDAVSSQPSRVSRDGTDVATDEAEGRRTLLRGENHAVFSMAGFPEAVQEQVAAAELRGAAVAAGLSSAGSYAYVATTAECSVWAYGSASSAISRVHRLAMPGSANAVDAEAPLVVLAAPRNEQGDIGVVVCSASGQLRYWDRVAFGLGGTDQFLSHALELGDMTDRCCRIIEVHIGLVVVGTAKGRLFRVSLMSAQGTPQLDACALYGGTARAGVLGRVSSLLGGGVQAPVVAEADDALVALAGGGRTEIRHSRELLVLTRTRLAKWVVSRSHPERLMYSTDIVRALTAVASGAEVAVLDVAVMSSGDICVLTALQTSPAVRRPQLAIAVLRSICVSAEPDVVHLWPLGLVYDGALGRSGVERPRLALPDGGPAMYVVFRRAVSVLVVASSGVAFEEVVSFRPGNPVLGFSAASRFPHTLQEPSETRLALVCQSAGVLSITVNIAKVLGSAATTLPDSDAAVCRPSTVVGSARGFQLQIEQAVFFGGGSNNPLSFEITSQAAGVDLALETAVLHISQAILDNTSHFIVDRLDLGAHLSERLRRIQAVMLFISKAGLTDKLSVETRSQLCSHAEKLAAASELWNYQNTLWARQRGSAPQLLANLATSFLDSVGIQGRDALRMFFRQHVASVGDLLVFMHRNLPVLRRALENSESGRHDSQIISFEANRIVLQTLQPALSYRFQNAELYQCKGSPLLTWTEHPAILDLLALRLEASYKLCRDLSGSHCAFIYERIEKSALPNDEDPANHLRRLSIFDDAVSASHASLTSAAESDETSHLPLHIDDPYATPLALLRETIDQMAPLANLCFRVFVDRIAHLQTAAPGDAQELSTRYEVIRSRFLMSLVPLARTPVAFRLAEEYHDLDSLVVLVFTTNCENAVVRLHRYIQRFGRGFVTALLAYYERRQAWASLLYIQDADLDAYLKEYIDQKTAADPHGPMAQIGWIHDVKMRDFGSAAAKLARAGRDSLEVDQARTMLSLSKLAFYTVDSQEDFRDDTIVEARTRLEDALELCEVQENLMLYFTAVVNSHRGISSDPVWRRRDDDSDKKAVLDAAMLTSSPELRHTRPTLYIVYAEFIRRVWNARSLSVEDLLDLLTFPDCATSVNAADSYNASVRERYSLAVDILSRASFNLPEQAREGALKTIWRRVFLSDDWSSIGKKLSGDVPDSALRDVLAHTSLYAVLDSCLGSRELAHPDWFLLPSYSFAADDIEYLVSTRLAPRFSQDLLDTSERPLSPVTSVALRKDYAEEDRQLHAAIGYGLDKYYAEIMRIVSNQISQRRSFLSTNDDLNHHKFGLESANNEALVSDNDEDMQMESE
ncbi:hypothetical protein COEREDRAFT_98484 [Coemansia reversa NRRL 1564]|uniref:Uncharacterized protein n=1 Tax=Coemansia reversa (strain ATCC 12441 / NRRL 1564) TaxID=763665 RepID=A0A2G5B7C1_COERN|nr:hypothetical protein COEREDRAFT_98484 [Coemansia reversa NRRL 1564]|eukprot:PIA14908.1 hypothetical protein COEREDRAFT_98484 [Coemansia reversa NRRL 1564]